MKVYGHIESSIPSPDVVSSLLADIGGLATAKSLCDKLVELGYSLSDSQLGIQRAMDDTELVVVEPDFKLRLVNKK